MDIVAGIRRSVEKRGMAGTWRFAGRLALSVLSGRMLIRSLRQRAVRRSDAEFDARNGVVTAGEVRSGDLRTGSCNKLFAAAYQPIDATHFREALSALDIRYEDYAFIDLGCGKGRALLLAAEFPFRRLAGVEFDPDLAATAEANLARYPATKDRAGEIEVLCEDAAAYPLPAGPLLVYMYNPFEMPVMERVVANVRRALELEPRELVVAYFTPLCAQAWDESGVLHRVAGSIDPAVYVAAGPARTGAGP